MKKLRNLKHIFVILIITIISILTIFNGLSESDIINTGYNLIYRTNNDPNNNHIPWQDRIYKHSLAPSSDIVIIKIDENTLNQLQAKNSLKMLSIAKKDYIDIIKKLKRVGVKGIGFDIVFQNTDPDEVEFAKVLNENKNIVIATQYINFCKKTYDTLWLEFNQNTDKINNPYPKIGKNETCESDIKNMVFLLEQAGIPIQKSEIIRNNTGDTLSNREKLDIYCARSISGEAIDCPGLPRSIYGNANWGIINNNVTRFDRPAWIDISNEAYLDWKGSGSTKIIKDIQIETLPIALYNATHTGSINGFLPVYNYSPEGVDRVVKNIINPYFGHPDSYPYISFIDVQSMSPVNLVTNFKNKYVLIGESGTMIHDSIESPVTSTQMTGVETHAHFLDGLLQNKMLTKASSSIIGIISIILVIISILFYFYAPKYLSPVFAIMMTIGIIWICRYCYDIQRLFIDPVPLLLSGTWISYAFTYGYRFFVVDREKRYIENAFGHYIDPKMVEMIDMEQVSVTLGGEVRELSVFFSDIAGFTTISEKLGPKALFGLMSLYLSRMTDILKQEGGTLDKYIGDAVMGFFGAPIAQEDHATRACRTALNMRRILPEINTEISARGIENINFRVGIATGDVMIGNIGSEDHFNYTVLGDTVNLASRLEASGKEYDVHIIISEGTRLQIGDNFELRELDTIAVKGKTEGVRIYELLGYKSDNIDKTLYNTYEQGLILYRAANYMEAGKIWGNLAESDPVSRVMMLRCIEIIKGNIQVENGIYHMTHK